MNCWTCATRSSRDSLRHRESMQEGAESLPSFRMTQRVNVVLVCKGSAAPLLQIWKSIETRMILNNGFHSSSVSPSDLFRIGVNRFVFQPMRGIHGTSQCDLRFSPPRPSAECQCFPALVAAWGVFVPWGWTSIVAIDVVYIIVSKRTTVRRPLLPSCCSCR
jgi:hypothetical protein